MGAKRLFTVDRIIQEEYDLLDEPGDIYPTSPIVTLDKEFQDNNDDEFTRVRPSAVELLKTFSLVKVD